METEAHEHDKEEWENATCPVEDLNEEKHDTN